MSNQQNQQQRRTSDRIKLVQLKKPTPVILEQKNALKNWQQ